MTPDLNALLSLPPPERADSLLRVADLLIESGRRSPADSAAAAAASAIVSLLERGEEDAQTRLKLGEALGRLGDPRLRDPADADYWAVVPLEDGDGAIDVGRDLVSNAEWTRFVHGGGYEDDALWDDDGRAWRDSGAALWRDLVRGSAYEQLLIPNQPVVGVTWHEAMAYARSHGARLLDVTERRQVVRGAARRPYPWGEPFGRGNANTREEVFGKPCAIGLFPQDATPEGVRDLAGNAAEWLLDEVGEQRFIHPGSWKQPSMASWAKAIALKPPDARADDLGFRLARDHRA